MEEEVPASVEAGALLTALRMAERHKHWGMFTSILTYIRDAGASLLYLRQGDYILRFPEPQPQKLLPAPSKKS